MRCMYRWGPIPSPQLQNSRLFAQEAHVHHAVLLKQSENKWKRLETIQAENKPRRLCSAGTDAFRSACRRRHDRAFWAINTREREGRLLINPQRELLFTTEVDVSKRLTFISPVCCFFFKFGSRPANGEQEDKPRFRDKRGTQCLSLHRREKLQKKNSVLEAMKKKKVLNVCEWQRHNGDSV